MFSTYLANLRIIASNLLLLYRNIFHWNISKIIIFLYSNIVGLIASIPFAGVIVYQYFTVYNTLGLSVGAQEFIMNNIGNIILTIVLFVIIVTIFIMTYTYGNFLTQNVYKNYLVGKKVPYTKNLYFSFAYFRTYVSILGRILLYLMIPVVIGVVVAIPVGIFIRMNPGAWTQVAGVLSLIFFIGLFAWFIALSIRLIFSYYELLYSDAVQKPKVYIDMSFRITKGRVWKIIFLLTPFLLTIGILGTLVQVGQETLVEQKVYSALKIEQQKTKETDHVLVERYFSGTDADRKAEFGSIEKMFPANTSDIDRDFLRASIPYMEVRSLDSSIIFYETIFMLLSFFLLEGTASMLYISVYHILKEESEKVPGFRLSYETKE